MDAILQVPLDGFRFDQNSQTFCKPRNNLDSKTNHFTSFNESESQNPNSDSPVCSDHLPVFKYINDMLMEDDLEGQTCMLEDSLAFQSAQRSFYEILQNQSPPSDQIYDSPQISIKRYRQEEEDDQSPPSDQIYGSLLISDITESREISEESVRRYREEDDNQSQPSDQIDGSREISVESVRRYHHRDEDEIESGRKSKLPAISAIDELAEKFEEALLVCDHGDSSSNKTTVRSKTSSNRTKNQNLNQNPIDMRNLLIQCAQSVSSFDYLRASEKLKEIRTHSSIHGDGTQRLGYHFAEALEARITGKMTTPVSATSSRTSMVEILKAYKGFVKACPTIIMCYFAANKTILELASKATTLHIIDFGILYGFQWPCLIQALSARAGGPPKLRVTGIELPQSGFRPSERVEETGRRLKRFCKKFNVPFEYSFIAKKWESIKLDEIMINPGETTVVNCILRLQYTPDETVSLDSPRDTALKLFRQINPDLFLFAEINGMYNSPFFLTRFKEALFHCSSLFDMFETTLSEEPETRTLAERELVVRDAMSVIACEGGERFARPETYKQWQVRILRAGFRPAKLNKQMLKEGKEIVKERYHKDFVIDNDNHWMCQSWKGRLMYAFSSWKPTKK